MDHHNPSPAPHPAEAGDGISHFCALPLELREEIYSYLLPSSPPAIIIRARYTPFRWLCASRIIFDDVAPSIYGKACFTTYTKLEPDSSLIGDFDAHLRLTYGPNYPPWLPIDASKLVKLICVDLAHVDLASLGRPADYFRTYFASTADAFPNLQMLHLNFHFRSTVSPSLSRIVGTPAAMDLYLESTLRTSVDELIEALILVDCEVEVSVYPN